MIEELVAKITQKIEDEKMLVIPNFIYQIFKDNDEDTARRVILIENSDYGNNG